MKTDLKTYQQNTINRIVNRCEDQKGFIIFHEMGSGKTRTGLSIMHHEKYKNLGKILVCKEETLYDTWIPEIDKIDKTIIISDVQNRKIRKLQFL